MVFDFFPWKIDVDLGSTKQFYEKNYLSTDAFINEKFTKSLTQKQLDFFDNLGVDLSKVSIEYHEAVFDYKEVYEVKYLLCGKLKSIASFQAKVYSDDDVFGSDIFQSVEVVDTADFELNKIDGMNITFKQPVTGFEDERFEKWDCGYVCGMAILKRKR